MAKREKKVVLSVKEISEKLQSLQRWKVRHLKMRMQAEGSLRAVIACDLGYSNGADPEARQKFHKDAAKIIKQVTNGELSTPYDALIKATGISIQAHEEARAGYEKEMIALAKQLPIAKWVDDKHQAGFGIASIATIIGETGDLANYSGPAKVWKRLGCAPFCKDGVVQMGSTWNKTSSTKKLSASDWEEYGYSPRRRSISFLLGENIVKGNHSIYRKRYDQVKKEYATKHPDRVTCSKCEGTGRTGRKACANCSGTGKVAMRAHLHAMLLATKLLLKNLWVEWNNHPPMPKQTW